MEDHTDKVDKVQEIIALQDKERRKIWMFYVTFFISLAGSLIPNPASLFFALICLFTLIAAYAVRSKAEEDSLLKNHMIHIIKSFWRANILLGLTLLIAGLYIFVYADYSSIYPCLYSLERYTSGTTVSVEAFSRVIRVCENTFVQQNKVQLLIAGIIALGPVMIFLLARYIKGLIHLKNNKLV